MAIVSPFRAIYPTPAVASAVAALPYDVMDTVEAGRLAAGNLLSFLRVSRAEIELPVGTDPHAEAVYEKAAANYRRLWRQAPLQQDPEPTFYVYALTREGRRQTGLVAALAVDDYEQDVIRKHEKTRPDKVQDRTRHILALRAHTGPVFLAYRDMTELDGVVAGVTATAPLVDFTAGDGVGHALWRVATDRAGAVSAAFARVSYLYIADGHHRAASASEVRAVCRDRNPQHTGQEAYNRFLGVVFPASQLRILPYNRVVKSSPGLRSEPLLAGLRAQGFEVRPAVTGTPTATGEVCLYAAGKWWAMRYTRPLPDASPVARLDVSVLQDHVLAPLLGIADPRTDTNIEFVGGIRGTAELEKRVNSGAAAVAFSMYPTTVQQLMAISDAGQIMPPKSTWFEPKLRDGLLIHDF